MGTKPETEDIPEITPAMIEAAVTAFRRVYSDQWDEAEPSFGLSEIVVREILIAALAASSERAEECRGC
jgi:hypothetical protein